MLECNVVVALAILDLPIQHGSSDSENVDGFVWKDHMRRGEIL